MEQVPTSLWHPQVRLTSIGSAAMVLLAAFEAMAVTTVMPAVARDLDGEALYAVAFTATLAASVVAMVVAGRWSDVAGPVRPMITATGFFLAGLLVAGLAPTMPLFVAGRFAQGLGAGGITVTLYVLIARVYPAPLHPRVFAVFSAAWVLPAMIGPLVAGWISDLIGWRWVFLGVAILVLPAFAALWPAFAAVRGRPVETPDAPTVPTPLAVSLAVVVSISLVGIGTLAELDNLALAVPLSALGMAVIALALRPLLPAGTLRARRGLGATILFRALVSAAYFGTEVYLPLMLQREYELSASRVGLVLTVGSLSWALGSQAQARLGHRFSSVQFLVVGSGFVAAGVAIQLTTAIAGLGVAGALSGWLVGGLGMGLAFPRTSTLMLEYSTPANQGFNSSALAISDAVGGSLATAVTGLVLVAAGGGSSGFAAVFAVCLALALGGGVVARRAGPAPVAGRD